MTLSQVAALLYLHFREIKLKIRSFQERVALFCLLFADLVVLDSFEEVERGQVKHLNVEYGQSVVFLRVGRQMAQPARIAKRIKGFVFEDAQNVHLLVADSRCTVYIFG